MYHYTLIQTSVYLQQKKSCTKRTLPVLCPSSFHRSTLSLSESGCKGRHFFYIYQIFYKLFKKKDFLAYYIYGVDAQEATSDKIISGDKHGSS